MKVASLLSLTRNHHSIALTLLTLITFLLQLTYVVTHGELSTLIYPDESTYYLPAAKQILESGLSYFLTPRSLWNGPINPLWIALWGANVSVIKIANIVLISLCSPLAWISAKKLFGVRAGYIAFLLLSLYPPFYVFSGTILTEPLYTFLTFLSITIFILNDAQTRALDISSGIVSALAALTRPTTQIFPILLVLAAFLFSSLFRNRATLKKGRLVCYLLGFLLLVLPFVLKNSLYLGKHGIANGSGAVLYLGNDLRKNGDEPVYSGMDFDTYAITKPYAHLDTEGDKLLTAKAVSMIRENPYDTALLTGRKILKVLFGYPHYYFYPRVDLISFAKIESWQRISFVTFEAFLRIFVTIFGIVALFTLRVDNTLRFLAAGFLSYMVLIHAITFPLPRLLIPNYPVLALFAAGWWSTPQTKRAQCSILGLSLAVLLFVCFVGRSWKPGVVSERALQWFDTVVDLSKAEIIRHDLTSSEGSSQLCTDGGRPFVEYSIPQTALQPNLVLLIKLTTTTKTPPKKSGIATLSWREGDSPFDPSRASSFELIPDGEPHLYQVTPATNPTWKGTVSSFRLDLPKRWKHACYELREATLAK